MKLWGDKTGPWVEYQANLTIVLFLKNQEIVQAREQLLLPDFCAHPVDMDPKQNLRNQILCNFEGHAPKETNHCHNLICHSREMHR